MNYTIYKTEPGVTTIDTQDFNNEKIDLVNISCLQEDNFTTLFDLVKNNTLTIELNGEIVKGGPVISKLITIIESDELGNDKFLNLDYSNKIRLEKMNFPNETLERIDDSYNQKIIDGTNYYRLKRASLVYDISSGTKTEQEVFEIDYKTKDMKQALISGDWKSAKWYLETIEVIGSFTQQVKDNFMVDINDYISNNY